MGRTNQIARKVLSFGNHIIITNMIKNLLDFDDPKGRRTTGNKNLRFDVSHFAETEACLSFLYGIKVIRPQR